MNASPMLLVTGGCGFIGSHFVRQWLAASPFGKVIVYDLLTYAGRPGNLLDIWGDRAELIVGDIGDFERVRETCLRYGVTRMVHFAAESHVDTSIHRPLLFTDTNVRGTQVLLEVCRELGLSFHQVSTDEVYGDVPADERRRETDVLQPRSPYSASKAAAEQLAYAYHVTYGLPVTITRGSNTVGSHQYPEKILPRFTVLALQDRELPVYGDGLQQRDYMHVEDHVRGILTVLERGAPGEIYNVGTGEELTNLALTRILLDTLGKSAQLIRHVTDRPGHDRRYAVDTAKLRSLGWACQWSSETAIRDAVRWYAENPEWWGEAK